MFVGAADGDHHHHHKADPMKPKKKLIRNMSTTESRAFCGGVLKSAKLSRNLPPYMKAGINLNHENFVTYEPTDGDDSDLEE